MTLPPPCELGARNFPVSTISSAERRELPTPGDGEAVVRVETAALNFSDLLMIDDRYQVRPPRPFIPGQGMHRRRCDGQRTLGLAAGQRVASKVLWGGFADYVAVRGDMAIPIPDGMSAAAASALPSPTTPRWSRLRRARL